jgi:hypothetical protein
LNSDTVGRDRTVIGVVRESAGIKPNASPIQDDESSDHHSIVNSITVTWRRKGREERMVEVPQGFHFAPVDEELVEFYLLPKLQGKPTVPNDSIIEANVYELQPDTLIGTYVASCLRVTCPRDTAFICTNLIPGHPGKPEPGRAHACGDVAQHDTNWRCRVTLPCLRRRSSMALSPIHESYPRPSIFQTKNSPLNQN